MVTKTCPVCGAKNTLKKDCTKFLAKYAQKEVNVDIPVLICSNCGAKFDFDKQDDILRKNALVMARNKSVTETLLKLEKEISFTNLEQSFSLPPKTLSKWKTGIKAPSAAAAALISLIGVFPWLSYVGMTNYEPVTAYKIAGAAFFNKATENEKINAFFSASDKYEAFGLYKDKTVTKRIDSMEQIPEMHSYYENIETSNHSSVGEIKW